MKKMFSLLFIAAVLFGCKKNEGCTDPLAANYDAQAEVDNGSCMPFQGPRNANFEDDGGWTFERAANLTCGGGIAAVSSFGFMPTKGIKYMHLEIGTGYRSGGNPLFAYSYQDNVDLSTSKTLTFDYQFMGTEDSVVYAEILFTSNGTQELWKKTLKTTSQKQNEVVNLGSFPDKGRLLIRLNRTIYTSVSLNDGVHIFEIDNIRLN